MPNWWDEDDAPPPPSGGNWWDDDEAAPSAPEPSRWGDYAGMALRGLSGFLAPGGLPGAAVAGAGDLLAQTAERVGGSRKAYNLGETGVSAGAGAIPFGKAGSLVARYLKGALFGGGTAGAMDVASQMGDEEAGDLDLGRTARAAQVGTLLGSAGAGVGHLAEKFIGRGKTPRLNLRDEAANAPTTLPKPVMGSDEVAMVAGQGGDLDAPVPLGPRSRREQIEGIDPSRIRPEATDSRAWWAPRVRGESSVRDVDGPAQPFEFDPDTRRQPQLRAPGNVLDIEGPAQPWFDTPRGPGNQGPAGLPPGGGSRRIPLSGGEPPERLTVPPDAEPFEVGPLTRETAPHTELPKVPRARIEPHLEELGAADARSNEGFLERFMRPFREMPSRAGKREPPPEITPLSVNEPVETGIENARRRGVPFIPAELKSTWDRLRPKWQETKAATGADMSEDLPFFSRRVLQGAENPRKLMGAERKALKQAQERGAPIYAGKPRDEFGTGTGQPVPRPDTRFADDAGDVDRLTEFLGDESGSIDPALARRLGVHAGSGLAGAALGAGLSDDEHRTRNTIGMGLLGAAAPSALSKGGAEALGKLRYFSLLGSTGAQAKNLVGNTGSVLVRAGEEAAVGNTDAAKSILKNVFSRDTASRIVEEFKNPSHADDSRWGKNTGMLGVFSRIMHSVDEGVTSGMERGGLSRDEARTSLFTSEPKSKSGKWITSRPEFMSSVMPFVRTGVNIAERGLEHTPGIGALPAVRAMRGDSAKRAAARQAMGALALLGGATAGDVDPYVAALLGPLALPASFGAAGRKAYEKRGDTLTNIGKGAAGTLRDALPLPSGSYGDPGDFDIGKYLATFVPGVLRDASIVNPRELEQSGLFDPAIAKIPYLNAALLKRKPKRRTSKASRQ